MRIAVLASKKDIAGMNIASFLQKKKIPIILIGGDSVFFDGCNTLDADMFIFATKHQSKKGVPSLCVHAIGNWGPAELGGKEAELGIAPAQYVKRALQLLEEKNSLGWEVFQEATHHGPSCHRPVLFLEIGSSEKEYSNETAAGTIAETIIDLLHYTPHANITAIGLGGLHHTPNFKKVQLKTDIAVGHICPKYNLQYVTKVMVLQAIEKTLPHPQLLLLDWKGLGEQKERIQRLVDEVAAETGIKVMRTQEF